MKKLLSVLLCAAMLVGGLTFAASADDKSIDKAMLIDDISVDDTSLTGGMGYIVNNHGKNDYGVNAWNSEKSYTVRDNNGISVAFDLNVIAFSQCTHLVSETAPNDFRHLQGLVFTFSNYDGYQAIIYDAVKQEFQIANVGWPTSVVPVDGSHIIEKKAFSMKPGEWHRCFYLVQATEVFVYCDGELIISHDFDGGPKNNLSRSFLMFWESHVRLMMDNLIVGTDEYDDTLGETFEEKIAANNQPDAEEPIKNVLFADDFNDAIDVVYDHSVTVPVWEYEKDEHDKDVMYTVYEDDGKTPKLDEYDEVVKEKHFLLDEKGNKVQAVDEKGNPLTEPEYHFIMNGEDTIEPGQEHAGFTFGVGVHNTQNMPCHGVDKATYCGMIKDIDGAVISFSDTAAADGMTVKSEITINQKSAAFTSAKNVVLSLDPIFEFKGFENIASGADIKADDNGRVTITLPAGFSGKLADLVMEVPAGKEMAQSSKYRYGFIVGSDAEIKNGAEDVDPAKITVDGGFTSTMNFLKGDANGDGKVNAKDVTLIMKYNVVIADTKNKEPNEQQQKVISSLKVKASDIYADNKINARDVNLLMKYLVYGEWK